MMLARVTVRSFHHISVLPREVIDGLATSYIKGLERPVIVDGTAGGGGHSKLILEALPNCHLLCIDRDVEALRACRTNLSDYISQGRVTLSHGSYAEAKKLLHLAGLPSKVDGVLVDLGVSSHQLDSAHRGFSYRMDSPLDMRFNQSDGADGKGEGKGRVYTSSDALVKLSEVELAKIIRDYGEEPKWRKAGQAIKDYINREGAIKTTGELMACLDKLGGGPKDKKKRAARVFQALRIHVNDELDHLSAFLSRTVKLLNPGGRLAVISFHSLEDRPVKVAFKRYCSDECQCSQSTLLKNNGKCTCNEVAICKLVTNRAIRPSSEEIAANSRSAPSKLRVIEKL